jgi:RecA-family ATPase
VTDELEVLRTAWYKTNGAGTESWVRDEPASSDLITTRLSATGGLLEFRSVADVLAEIADAPPPTYLAKPVWPSDAYGIVGAESKAGKTWAVCDLAVNVAGAGAWFGHFPVERSGPVLMFLGEGGRRKMVRRLEAISTAYDLELAELPIRLCFRAPHLTNDLHLAQMAEEIERTGPVLVVIDPLYLAARGAQGSQLYDMGAHLEEVQQLCQRAAAALVIVHHFNRQIGKGAARLQRSRTGRMGARNRHGYSRRPADGRDER